MSHTDSRADIALYASVVRFHTYRFLLQSVQRFTQKSSVACDAQYFWNLLTYVVALLVVLKPRVMPHRTIAIPVNIKYSKVSTVPAPLRMFMTANSIKINDTIAITITKMFSMSSAVLIVDRHKLEAVIAAQQIDKISTPTGITHKRILQPANIAPLGPNPMRNRFPANIANC